MSRERCGRAAAGGPTTATAAFFSRCRNAESGEGGGGVRPPLGRSMPLKLELGQIQISAFFHSRSSREKKRRSCAFFFISYNVNVSYQRCEKRIHSTRFRRFLFRLLISMSSMLLLILIPSSLLPPRTRVSVKRRFRSARLTRIFFFFSLSFRASE